MILHDFASKSLSSTLPQPHDWPESGRDRTEILVVLKEGGAAQQRQPARQHNNSNQHRHTAIATHSSSSNSNQTRAALRLESMSISDTRRFVGGKAARPRHLLRMIEGPDGLNLWAKSEFANWGFANSSIQLKDQLKVFHAIDWGLWD